MDCEQPILKNRLNSSGVNKNHALFLTAVLLISVVKCVFVTPSSTEITRRFSWSLQGCYGSIFLVYLHIREWWRLEWKHDGKRMMWKGEIEIVKERMQSGRGAFRRKVRECYRKTWMESREKEKLLDEEGRWHKLCKGPWLFLVFMGPKFSCQLWLSSIKLLPHN